MKIKQQMKTPTSFNWDSLYEEPWCEEGLNHHFQAPKFTADWKWWEQFFAAANNSQSAQKLQKYVLQSIALMLLCLC